MERKHIIVFAFLVLTGLLCHAQGFDDLKKAKPVSLNKKLQALVNQNDAKGLEKLLQSKPDLKEEGSAMGYNDNGAPLVVPLFYDVIDRTLSGDASLELCRVCLAAGCDVYTIYNGKTPIYRVMDFFATTPSANSQIGMELLKLLFAQKGFDINRRYRSLPPPFSYLLSENYKFLGNKYSKDYLSTELIRLLLDNGARLNTYDENGASLLLLANSTDNVYLQDYLVEHGVNINKAADAEGNNAVYAAIADNNVHLLETIVKNYGVRITTPMVKEWTSKVNPEMFEYLCKQCADNANTYKEIVEFRSHFSDKKDFVKDKYENLARKEVAQTNDYQSIMKCKERYPDMTALTEPKFKEIATNEINAAKNIVQIKTCEERYPDFQQLINPKKRTIYDIDVKNLAESYSHAKDLISRSSFSYQSTMADIANSFVKNYQNYYDPDAQLPLAEDLSQFYSVLSTVNQGYSYSCHKLPKAGLFNDEKNIVIGRLQSAYSSLQKCGHGLSSEAMLSSIDKDIKAAVRYADISIKEYRDFCETLRNRISVEERTSPSGKFTKGLFDTYSHRFNEGRIVIKISYNGNNSRLYFYYNEYYSHYGSQYEFEHYETGFSYYGDKLLHEKPFNCHFESKSLNEIEAGIIERIVKFYYSFL